MRRYKFQYTFLCFFIALFSNHSLSAQISLVNGGGGGYTEVRSYQGVTMPNHYILQMDINGENVNISNWSVSVRVKKPIKNSEGKILDPSKVSLQLNTISARRGAPPTIPQVGAIIGKIPLSLTDVPIIPSSQYPIKTGANSENNNQIWFSFDIIVEGGRYLEQLKSWNQYPMELEFTFKSAHANPFPTNRLIEFQIYPNDTPPVEPVYSIQVNNDATNGKLEFKSISDYVNGVSQTYANGLSVVSNTPYALQVKAQSSAFESLDNGIPLNTVNLNVKAVNNNSVAGTVQLSNVEQTIIGSVINSGTQVRAFDIRYFTSPNDTRLQNAKPDTYKTTLIYTMIPQ
jgi:hypothetical protein